MHLHHDYVDERPGSVCHAGYPHMFETMYGAGYGYDIADAGTYGGTGVGPTHQSFIIWLIVFSGAVLLILGGLRAGGFHFVVKT